MVEERITVVEFYSGIGGMHYALQESKLSFEILAAFDVNTTANSIYKHNFPTVPLKQRNIQGLSAAELDKFDADLWTMSPPCQPFTRQGKQLDLADTRTDSFQHLLNIFMQMTKPPRKILLENVKGFENSKAKQEFVSNLKQKDYSFKEYLLNPLQFGIPNSRLRYYLLAWKNGPTRTIEENQIFKSIETVSEIEPAPISGFLELSPKFEQLLLPDKVLCKQAEVLDIVQPDSKQCCCFTKSYTQYAEGTGSVLFDGNWKELDAAYVQYRSATSAEDKIAALKSLKLRYFSWREVANLMCFPVSFEPASDTTPKQMYRMLGNSINVRVVGALLSHLCCV